MLISGGQIAQVLFSPRLVVFAPERLREEFDRHKEEIIQKSHLSYSDFDELSSLLFQRIIFISLEEYKDFLPQTKDILKDHIKDQEFIALCLAKRCKLWTYERLLCELGFGISTLEITRQISQT